MEPIRATEKELREGDVFVYQTHSINKQYHHKTVTSLSGNLIHYEKQSGSEMRKRFRPERIVYVLSRAETKPELVEGEMYPLRELPIGSVYESDLGNCQYKVISFANYWKFGGRRTFDSDEVYLQTLTDHPKYEGDYGWNPANVKGRLISLPTMAEQDSDRVEKQREEYRKGREQFENEFLSMPLTDMSREVGIGEPIKLADLSSEDVRPKTVEVEYQKPKTAWEFLQMHSLPNTADADSKPDPQKFGHKWFKDICNNPSLPIDYQDRDIVGESFIDPSELPLRSEEEIVEESVHEPKEQVFGITERDFIELLKQNVEGLPSDLEIAEGYRGSTRLMCFTSVEFNELYKQINIVNVDGKFKVEGM